MRPNAQKSFNLDNNISKTGYRALYILMKLLESPKARAELIDCAANDPVINKDFSKDTITNTINLLKKAGCIISRPTKKTNNKYVIKSHPFVVNFSKQEVEALQIFRKSMLTMCDWQMLLRLNNLYSKAAKFAPNDELADLLKFGHPFNRISGKILRDMIFSRQKLISIKYNSPKYGIEDFDIIPHFINFENEKLYVWCYNCKYNATSFLRIDRILNINYYTFDYDIAQKQDKFEEQQFKAVYELKGSAAMMYIPGTGEKIIEENKNDEFPLKIEILVKNKFNFIQKLLSYGTECRILSPKPFIKEFLETLERIKGDYIK